MVTLTQDAMVKYHGIIDMLFIGKCSPAHIDEIEEELILCDLLLSFWPSAQMASSTVKNCDFFPSYSLMFDDDSM